jgi:hypothetical protein
MECKHPERAADVWARDYQSTVRETPLERPRRSSIAIATRRRTSMFRYISDDVKLDDHSTHTIEAKLGILGEAFGMKDRWAGARFEGILQYVRLHDRFGSAIIAHVALTVPFDY